MFRSLFHDHLQGCPSFLVHLLPFSCLLHHLSFLGMWPYAIYLYVCPVYLSVCCLVVNALRTKDSSEDGPGIGTETCRVFILTLFTEHF
jgi:hypothetical protein